MLCAVYRFGTTVSSSTQTIQSNFLPAPGTDWTISFWFAIHPGSCWFVASAFLTLSEAGRSGQLCVGVHPSCAFMFESTVPGVGYSQSLLARKLLLITLSFHSRHWATHGLLRTRSGSSFGCAGFQGIDHALLDLHNGACNTDEWAAYVGVVTSSFGGSCGDPRMFSSCTQWIWCHALHACSRDVMS
jgi:hypothetical protein